MIKPPMLSFDEALAIVVGEARPLAVERIPLVAAHRRVLARPVLAAIEAPFADVSTMDGYAIRDVDAGRALAVVGESFPGGALPLPLEAGDAWRVFIGAPVPPGTDRVAMQERATRGGDRVSVSFDAGTPRFIRHRGSDFANGAVLLHVGRVLDGPALIAAAGGDVAEVAVRRRPRVAIVTNGDELVAPGSARDRPGAIPESISLGLAALATEGGATIESVMRVRDNAGQIAASLFGALHDADVVIIVGGASVGERDFAKRAFAALGGELLFSKAAIKPGKPVWFGRFGDALVLGLPGNPTSAYVTARLFLAPLLAGLGGGVAALEWRTARLGAPLEACDERETFVRGVREGDRVRALDDQNSGSQAVLAQADVLIRRRPFAPPAAVGDTVEVLSL